MATDPWAAFNPQPAPQQAPQSPGVIMGRPKAPSPAEQQRLEMEAQRLQMQQQDQILQERQAGLTAQNTSLDIQKKQQAAAAGPAGEATESERKASSFLKRAMNAESNYGSIDFDPNTAGVQPVQPRSIVGQSMYENTPNLLNSLPAAIGNSRERQLADQAQREFIAAILRYDSGAAIPPEEFTTNAQIYFPQPGDGPDVIAQKRQARQVAIQGLKDASGRMGANVDLSTERQQGATVLPNASMGRVDPGMTPNGVQDSATGGLRAIPEFRGMAGDVQSMIQQGASADQVLAYISKRHADAGYQPPDAARVQFIQDVVAAHQQRPDIPVSSLAQEWQALEMQQQADRGGSLLGSVMDSPVGAGAIGAGDVMTGGFLDEMIGALGGNTDNARSVMSASAQERPVSTFAGNVIGSAILPTGRVTSAIDLAKVGGAYGAIYGAGSANGDIGDRLTGAAIGGAIGATTGALTGKASNALANRSANVTERQIERNALLQDFQQQGVNPMPANVGGAPTRVATSGAGQAFISSGAIRGAAEKQAGQFGEAVTGNAAKAGQSLAPDEAGLLARSAGERFSKETSARGSKLYDRAETAAGNTKIRPDAAIMEIDDKIARLSQSPDPGAKGLVKELQGLKKSLEGGVSVVGLRDARTRLSQGVYDGKLRSTADQKVYRDILDKVSTDIETGLRSQGKDRAAGMFKTADSYWKDRVEHIDQVLEPIIGKGKSGEDILSAIESMASGKRGGVSRLSGLVRSLSDKERGDLQATIIERLGKSTAGAQDAEGAAFSANTFLTRWNNMSQKGKAALFGNSDLRQSLDQLARVAGSIKDAGRYTNTSNTAGALGWQGLLSGGALQIAGAPTAVAGGVAQFITGRMLASPKFAAWLARAPKTPNASYVSRLKGIATAEPVIAADINRFAQFLNAANDVSPSRAAAQGQQENN